MINPQDISVVVQGPITGKPDEPFGQRLTAQCLQSVREHLPGAEIILSTWKDSDVSDLSFDVLIKSDDPGGCIYGKDFYERPVYHNANRQITSMRAGLLVATRAYAVKLRSDMLLTGSGFVRYFGKYTARCEQWRVLRERVVASTVYSRNPHRRYPYPFHPSDWFHFGLREDLLNIWDIPHSPEPEMSRWFDTHPKPPQDFPDFPPAETFSRYYIEQWIWTAFLRKHGELRFDHRTDFENDAVNVSELTIANNLVLVEPDQLQLKFVKYPVPKLDWATLYTHGEWLRLYKKFCEHDISLSPDTLALRKRAYLASLPIYTSISSPANAFKWTRKVSDAWAERSPATFHALKNAYTSIMSVINRGLNGKE